MADQAKPPVAVRCRQTGFRARIPAKDWDAYTEAQRDAYEVLDAVPAAAPDLETIEEAPRARSKAKEG